MRNPNSSRSLKILSGLTLVAGAVALVSSCGGGGGGGGDQGTPATIDVAGVTSAIADFGGLIPICKDATAGSVRAARSARALKVLPALLQSGLLPQNRALMRQTERSLALSGTPPADQLGDCGGRFGYRNYSHVNGVTTATLAFEDYCTTDSATGGKETITGGIAFVNTATPTVSGPITSKLEAHTSSTLTAIAKDAAGATMSSGAISFTGFKMVVGVPGGDPTAADPNVLTMGELKVTNDATGKTYRETDWTVTQIDNAATATSEYTMSGRGYRSSGQYFDIVTDQPLVQNSSGDVTGGKVRFTGSNGSEAVVTVVPGPTMQVKMTVNGAPLTLPSMPVCTAN
jgi:hypothetical protein